MRPNNQTLRLQLNHYRSYIAISCEDMEVGFCTPEFAAKMVEIFNEYERLHEENETLNKALKLACTRAIAFLLRERQQALDISNREFVRFCASYKLAPQQLKDIFQGKDIPDSQLKSLSHILGKSVDELIEVRDGFSDSELNRLARILGTSNDLAQVFSN